MKFTLSWLKEHLETDASLEAILEALTDLGLEVEGVEDPAARLGEFTICRVIEAVQHPNADRLRLCRVETWPAGPDPPSEEVQVVCGDPANTWQRLLQVEQQILDGFRDFDADKQARHGGLLQDAGDCIALAGNACFRPRDEVFRERQDTLYEFRDASAIGMHSVGLV